MLIREAESPWGALVLAAEAGRLFGVHFADSSEALQARAAASPVARQPLAAPHAPAGRAARRGPANLDDGLLDLVEAQLADYAAGRLAQFDLPLAERGSSFQWRIWQTLQQVPYGSTVSYGELAARAGRPGAARAVGGAVGANPWVIVVPCHRVLAGGGRLGGFSSGLERKRGLLRHERIAWREAPGAVGRSA